MWRVYRTLAALGVPRSVYYAWNSRDDLRDRTAKPCRVYEVLPEERAAICEDDGRCGDGLRRGDHGLQGFERCGPLVAMEAIDGIER
jgi:hypothetical protein